jgi:uncharacterized protein with GYD domain
MPMYIVLGRFTDEGARDIKGILQGFEENRARGEQMGLKPHAIYITQGQYDFVVVVEAPDDQTMLKQSFGVATAGRSRSETLRAYTLDEVRQLVQ